MKIYGFPSESLKGYMAPNLKPAFQFGAITFKVFLSCKYTFKEGSFSLLFDCVFDLDAVGWKISLPSEFLHLGFGK